METVDFKEMKKQLDKEKLKRKAKDTIDGAKQKAEAAVNYCMEHPVEALSIITASTACINKLVRYKQTKAEDRRRQVDFYDNRLGTHAIARRPLSAKESLEVERRYRSGESYKSILWNMRLLK